MNPLRKSTAICFAALSFASYAAHAVNDPNAAIIKLRHPDHGGCVEAGLPLNNCVSAPSANFAVLSSAASFVVEIGPGTFGQMQCGVTGGPSKQISIRGAGVDQTILASVTSGPECARVAWADMTIGGTGVLYSVVLLHGGTTTTWTNVKLASSWQEYCNSGGGGSHYWFGSQLAMGSGGYYQVRCDESWFYGSEIMVSAINRNEHVRTFEVSGSELHVYGSVIRAVRDLGTSLTGNGSLTAVRATGGEVHIHGTGIDVLNRDASATPITALNASGGATIHANGAAYNMQTGPGGSVTRINNNGGTGHIHAPYLWEHIPDTDGNPATVDTNFTSANGADQTTVTVGTSDGHPHTAVYSTTCPANARWYDTTDKVCRSQ